MEIASIFSLTVVMGAFLLGIVALIGRVRSWQSYSVSDGFGVRQRTAGLADTAVPISWMLAFLVLSLGLAALAILAVGGELIGP